MVIEKDTTYAYAIKHLQNPSFECIRNVAVNFRKGLSDEEQAELYDMLNRGVDLISNEPQMMMYLHSFGLMHQAKLKYAFKHLPHDFLQEDTIEIIDYGCGQAIGEMVYADYLRSHSISQNVKRITLIEPSEICLKRAALHAKLFFPDAEIRTVCKTFDRLTDEDIETDDNSTKLHILSNVLDIQRFNLRKFANLIDNNTKGYNQYVCVGPYFNYPDKDERMGYFARFLGGNITHSECFDKYAFVQNKSWTCNVCIFNKGMVSNPETYTDEQGVEYGNYGKLLKRVPTGLTEYTIPDSVTEIGSDAFSGCSSLQSVNIPDSVTEIGGWAFRDCSSLQSINIPNSVTEIEDWAFEGCISLQSIKVDRNNKNYCANNDVLFNKNKTILIKCSTKYKEYTVPDSVTEIGSEAFEGCSVLRSITIPDSVTEIGGWAFRGCSSLQSIHIPKLVTEIGDEAFEGCNSLQSINIPDSVTEIGEYAFYGCSSLQSITIPDSVTEIGSETFYGCRSLQSINIPNSVTGIGGCAFYGCSSLQSIKVDRNNKNYCANNDVLFNKNKTILIRCSTKYKEYIVPDSVTEIGGWAFRDCSSLQSINIPNSVTGIGGCAFYGCSSLQSITIPDSVTEIGEYAFRGCSSLQSIHIPKLVTEIGDEAFEGCNSLQSINIPDSVTEIGEYAFYGCSSLQNIKVSKNVNKDVLRQILEEIDSDIERLSKLKEQLPAVESEEDDADWPF